MSSTINDGIINLYTDNRNINSNTSIGIKLSGKGFINNSNISYDRNGIGLQLYNNSSNIKELSIIDTSNIYNSNYPTLRFTINSNSIGIKSITSNNIYKPLIINDYLTITSNNIGIGTSNPTATLDVRGNMNLLGSLNISNVELSSSISSLPISSISSNLISGTSSFYYLLTTLSNTINFTNPIYADILLVGAGGDGGSGSYSGGGGAGEVIYYPNFLFNSGIYDFFIGYNYPKPWAIYTADNYNSITNQLLDISGNNRHATCSGTITKTTASGNGAIAPITFISGNTSSTISFPPGSIPTNFTILSLTRYNGGTRRRILDSQSGNWLHGFYNQLRGVAFYNGWKTSETLTGTVDDWLCCIGKNNGLTPNNILIDGVGKGTVSGGDGGGSYRLSVNIGTGETSDWALSCVYIWDTILTDNEMINLNNIINYYKNTGLLINFNDLNKTSIINKNNIIVKANNGGDGAGIIKYSISGSGTYSSLIFISNTNDAYISFTSGTSTLLLNDNINCDILIVGGGGGGGSRHAGGGGAGAVIYLTNQTLLPGNYTITIGTGGAGATSPGSGANGNDSSINVNNTNIYLAKGGGYGSYLANGNDGGSGGGAIPGYTPGNPVNTNIPTGIYGNKGGNGTSGDPQSWAGGGGGGASNSGKNAVLNASSVATAGNGGDGIAINIIGSNSYYGGGGGGGCFIDGISAGNGGIGGGGAGSKGDGAATNGIANTGGGGGGGGFSSGGNGNGGSGGSGIVIIRIKNIYKSSKSGGSGGGGLGYYYDIIKDTTSNLLINSDRYISFNYNNSFLITSNLYNITFSNGTINFGNSIIDNSYPILKDSNNNTINPVVWYTFDNNNNLGLDISGNGYNLTNNNNTSNNRIIFTKGNSSIYFNGSTQYLSTSSFYNLNGISFSICFWYYSTISTLNNINIIGSISAITTASITETNYLQFANFTGTWSIGGVTQSTTAIEEQNTWNFITYIFNSIGTNKQEILYKNGIQIGLSTTRTSSYNFTNLTFSLGRRTLTDNYMNWTGYIDDFRVYNQVLTSNQVNELYKGRVEIYNIKLDINQAINGAIQGLKYDESYSLITSGNSGTTNKGGNGGNALISNGYISNIIGSNIIVGIGGTGVGITGGGIDGINYGDGGSGNNGKGRQGLIIININSNLTKLFNIKCDNFNINNLNINCNLRLGGAIYKSDGSILISSNFTNYISSQWKYQITNSNNIYYDKGYIGIGTINPISHLHLSSSNINSEVELRFTDATTGYGRNNGLILKKDNLQSGVLWNYENADLIFGTNSQERLRIKNNGNIGIGSTSPNYTLDVNGIIGCQDLILKNINISNIIDSRISITSNILVNFSNIINKPDLSIYPTFSTLSNKENILTFNNPFVKSNNIISLLYDNSLSISNGNLKVANENKWLSNSSNIYYSNGNVGIGLTNPSSSLHIIGDIKLSGNILRNDNSIYKVSFNQPININSNIFYYSNSQLNISNFNISTITSNKILDLTTNFINVSNLNISNNLYVGQKIGINVINPTFPLEISSSMNISNFFTSQIGLLQNSGSSTQTNYSSSNIVLKANGTIWTTTNYIASSDERIKKNINNINDNEALNKILKIEPKIYNYIDYLNKGNSNIYGFIAQEIKEHIPEAITIQEEYIPNIYKIGKIINNEVIIDYNISNIIKINDNIKIITENNINEYTILDIKSSNSFIINKNLNYICDCIIYGTKVYDFHTLDKSYIYTLNVSATQDLFKIIQKQEKEIKDLEKSVDDLLKLIIK